MSTPEATGRRTRVPHADARRRIGAAAERLLDDHRFSDLTVDLVMNEAGLARTVFYRHFTDLSRLVLGLLDDLRLDVLDPSPAGPAPDLYDAPTLHAALTRTVGFFAEHARLIRALEDAGRTEPSVAAAHQAFVDATVDRLAQLLDPADPDDVRERARALTLFNSAYLTDAFTRSPRVAPDRALGVVRMVWNGALGGSSDA